MPNQYEVIEYFSRKGDEWSKYDSLEKYIKQKGRNGLAEEFRNDRDFDVVCQYANEVGELQLRSDITKSVEDLVGAIFGFPFAGALDVIIGAIEDVCGKKFIAGKLIKGGLVLLTVAALAAAFSGKKK